MLFRSPSSVNWSSGRRRENTSGHRQGGGSPGGAIPHRSSSPLHASLPRRRKSVSSRVLPTLKLAPYNGSTCLKTFLAKFENCSDYYAWDDRERLCHLRASLEGSAGQVLWDAGQQSSVEDVITLLKNRFGSLNEEERYRSELKARRRRRGEPLQAVYQDIRRLMALAFPGQSGPLWEIMARDAFVESLADPALRLRVLERDAGTLEQALKLATRLEALGYGEVEDNWDDMGRRKDRFVKASVAEGNRELTTLVQELKSEVAELAAEMNVNGLCPRSQEGRFGPPISIVVGLPSLIGKPRHKRRHCGRPRRWPRHFRHNSSRQHDIMDSSQPSSCSTNIGLNIQPHAIPRAVEESR